MDFDAVLIEFNWEDDHVHLLINYPPKVAISNLVNSLKGVSSRHLRKDFPEIKTNFGVVLYGLQVTLLQVAVVRH